jgi:hypothetical protein
VRGERGIYMYSIRVSTRWHGIYKYHDLLSLFIFFIQPLKMDLTEGSETSAKLNLTPWKYPKENIKDSEHGENLK